MRVRKRCMTMDVGEEFWRGIMHEEICGAWSCVARSTAAGLESCCERVVSRDEGE